MFDAIFVIPILGLVAAWVIVYRIKLTWNSLILNLDHKSAKSLNESRVKTSNIENDKLLHDLNFARIIIQTVKSNRNSSNDKQRKIVFKLELLFLLLLALIVLSAYVEYQAFVYG